MTKILLVEDDKSLREIYGVRLFAEGYDVVSAGDGEEALAVAIKERPSLIITDVMMPKISGFDMLDILRSTTETKDIKVIVMTALGSEDNKDRGERLGADKYLIKSQVGIEDVVRFVHELLGDSPPAQGPAPAAPGISSPAQPSAVPPQQPPAMRPAATIPLPPRPVAPAAPVQPSPAATRPGMVSAPNVAVPGIPANQQPPVQPQPMQPTPMPPSSQQSQTPEPPTRRTKVIQPINDPASQRVDIQALVDKELAKEGSAPAATADEERQIVADQLDNFAAQPTAPAAPVVPPELPPVNPPPTPPATSPAPAPNPNPAPPVQGATTPPAAPTPPPAQTPPPMSPGQPQPPLAAAPQPPVPPAPPAV